MLALIATVLGVLLLCIAMAWAEGHRQGTKVPWIRVWPLGGQRATELVQRLRHADGVRDAVAVYRGTLPSNDYKETGWATVDYVSNRTGTAALAFLPPDPALTLWKGHEPDVQSLDEALVAYELAQSLGIGLGDTLDVRGLAFTVVGIWGPSARVPGNWLQVSSAAADLIEPSSADSASCVLVLPARSDDAQQVAARIRERWTNVEVVSPRWEEASSARERMLLVAVVVVAATIGLLLGVSTFGTSEAPGRLSWWVVMGAGASGVTLAWVVAAFANWYCRATLGLTPFSVDLSVVGCALLLSLVICLLGRPRAARRVGAHFAVTAALVCLCAAVVVVMGAARESLLLTVDAARDASADWVSLGGTAPTEGLLQGIYRLPGIRALSLEAYGGPVREEDTRWRGAIPAAGVLYGVESASGIGSWTLPISGGFAAGGDLGTETDEAVVGYDLARDQGLGVGDVFLVRGIPLRVMGVKAQVPAFPGSDAGRRVYVTFDTLGRILHERDIEKQITLLVPAAESQEVKELFLREVANRLQVGQIETIDDRLGGIVANYPSAWTIAGGSSSEMVRHAQALYDGLLAVSILVGVAVASVSVTASWTKSVTEAQERIGLLKALGSTEGRLLGGYLEQIMVFGSACGLAGVVVGQAACALLNIAASEGGFRLVVTPGLVAGVFIGSVVVVLVAATGPVAAAVRRGATEVLYAEPVGCSGAPEFGTEVMHGGSRA